MGALAGIPFVFAGCSTRSEPPLRVGANVWPGFECLFLARKLGLFDKHPIKLVEYSSTPEALRAFSNGALEVIAVTGDEFLRLAVHEPSLRAILVTDISLGADALLALPDIPSVRELRGRRVGVEVNAAGIFVLTRALALSGLAPRDVEIVPLEIDNQADALREKQVEAVVAFEPVRSRMVTAGAHVLFDSARIPGEVLDVLAVRESVLMERLDRLRALAGAWFSARTHLEASPREAAELMAPREGVTPEEFLASLALLKIPSLEENHAMLREGGPLLENLRQVHEAMAQTQTLLAAAPHAGLLDAGALP